MQDPISTINLTFDNKSHDIKSTPALIKLTVLFITLLQNRI